MFTNKEGKLSTQHFRLYKAENNPTFTYPKQVTGNLSRNGQTYLIAFNASFLA